MHCRDLPAKLFDIISAELTNPNCRDGTPETITGLHERYGLTILVRDATRCMALVAAPQQLDAVILRSGLN